MTIIKIEPNSAILLPNKYRGWQRKIVIRSDAEIEIDISETESFTYLEIKTKTK
jgi:hypothetical protein